MDQYIPGIVGAVVCFFISLLLGAAARGAPAADPVHGQLVFRHHIVLRLFSFIAAFGIPLALTVLVFINPPGRQQVPIVLMIYGLFAVITFPLLWPTWRYYLKIGPEGMESRGSWWGQEKLNWNQIKKVSYSAVYGWFTVFGTNRRRIRISFLIPGLPVFLEECEKHLPPEAMASAEVGYAALGRKLPTLSGPQAASP